MVTRFARCLPAVLLALCLWVPSPALAQEEGVTVDPGSPAEKEYAIPITKERRDASGSEKKQVRKNDRAAPLFGAGVEPDPAEGSASGGGTSSAGGSTSGGSGGSSGSGTARKGGGAGSGSGGGSAGGNGTETASASSAGVDSPRSERERERVSSLATAGTADDGPLGSTALVLGGTALLFLAAVIGGMGMRRRGTS